MDAIELNFKNYLTVSSASKILGVSKTTIRTWSDNGKLKTVIHPINGYRLFKEQDLQEILWKLK